MQSLQIMEGLIGTACAVACLYYARRSTLAAQPQNFPQAPVPWHSALGEYARRNPFAAVFGALAFGFLASSWMMYAAPRAIALPPRTVEKVHTITRNVPTPDPAQTARITALQTIINANTVTIASQKSEIDGLKKLLAKAALDSTRHGTLRRQSEANGDAAARPTEAKNTAIVPGATAAGAAARANPPSFAPDANAGAAASPPPSQPTQGSVTTPGNGTSTNAPAGSAGNANAAPQTAPSVVPH